MSSRITEDMLLNEEIPRHRKKRASSTSKSLGKSKHRHTFKDCLFIVDDMTLLYKGKYCTECGKIGDFGLETGITEKGNHYLLTAEEVLEKHKKLERIKIGEIWQKYVPIVKGEKE